MTMALPAPIAPPRPSPPHGAAIDLERWPGLAPPPPSPARAAVARRLLLRVAAMTGVTFDLAGGTSGERRERIGRGSGPALVVHRPDAFLARLGRDGKIGFGESYMAGEWDASGDLADVLEPMASRMRTLVPPRLQWVRHLYEPRQPAWEDNDPLGSRRNISRHYDLSNHLFALFLDRTMTYSSALFDSEDDTLEQAQVRKIERLLDRTCVGPGCRVLEIGSGWGELALRAASRGAKVTTLTLSHEQAHHVRRRVAAAGLADAVEVRLEDYRRHSGTYDAVLSVEMVEAVGERWWPTYFQTIEARLAPGGRAGLQSILMGHHDLAATRRSWTWIHKYIFPGGIIPSLEAIGQTVTAHTGLRIREHLHFGVSYAETLRRWRAAFDDRAPSVSALGFDEAFHRMWDFYLAYSEAGFRSGYLDVAQLVLSR